MAVQAEVEGLALRDAVRELARERIEPRAAEIDRTAQYSWDVVDLFRRRILTHVDRWHSRLTISPASQMLHILGRQRHIAIC